MRPFSAVLGNQSTIKHHFRAAQYQFKDFSDVKNIIYMAYTGKNAKDRPKPKKKKRSKPVEERKEPRVNKFVVKVKEESKIQPREAAQQRPDDKQGKRDDSSMGSSVASSNVFSLRKPEFD